MAAGAPGVLANDNDAEGATQTVTAVLVSGPSNASAFALNANGSFSYTPNPGFTGSDSFTYKPFDGVLNGNTVTVSLTVLATGASPVAEADAYHTAKDTPLAVAAVDGVLNNDHSALPHHGRAGGRSGTRERLRAQRRRLVQLHAEHRLRRASTASPTRPTTARPTATSSRC